MKKSFSIVLISLFWLSCTGPDPDEGRPSLPATLDSAKADSQIAQVTGDTSSTSTAETTQKVVNNGLSREDSIAKWKNGYATDSPGKGQESSDFLIKPKPGVPYDTALYNRQAPLREHYKNK